MPGEITEATDLAALVQDPVAIAAALALLRALERLEVVLTVKGVVCRGVVRFADTGAVVEVEIPAT